MTRSTTPLCLAALLSVFLGPPPAAAQGGAWPSSGWDARATSQGQGGAKGYRMEKKVRTEPGSPYPVTYYRITNPNAFPVELKFGVSVEYDCRVSWRGTRNNRTQDRITPPGSYQENIDPFYQLGPGASFMMRIQLLKVGPPPHYLPAGHTFNGWARPLRGAGPTTSLPPAGLPAPGNPGGAPGLPGQGGGPSYAGPPARLIELANQMTAALGRNDLAGYQRIMQTMLSELGSADLDPETRRLVEQLQTMAAQMGSLGLDPEALKQAGSALAGGPPAAPWRTPQPMAPSPHGAALKNLQGLGAAVARPSSPPARGTLSGSDGMAPGTLSTGGQGNVRRAPGAR